MGGFKVAVAEPIYRIAPAVTDCHRGLPDRWSRAVFETGFGAAGGCQRSIAVYSLYTRQLTAGTPGCSKNCLKPPAGPSVRQPTVTIRYSRCDFVNRLCHRDLKPPQLLKTHQYNVVHTYNYVYVIFEPTCATAQWAHLHHFLSVCTLDWNKIWEENSYLQKYKLTKPGFKQQYFSVGIV